MSTHELDLQTRHFGFTTRSFNEAARTCDFIASTTAIDSYDEVVEQDWDLSRYKKNPIVLWMHKKDAPIGHCERIEVVGGRLECTIKFERHEQADQVFRMIGSGTLRAVSVGFMPGQYRVDKRGGKDVYVMSGNKLHEISVVTIPANPEALAKAVGGRRAGIAPARGDDDDLEELEEPVRASDVVRAIHERRGTAQSEGWSPEAAVDALVGVKIAPAYRENFLRLARIDREKFEATVADMPTIRGLMLAQRRGVDLETTTFEDEDGTLIRETAAEKEAALWKAERLRAMHTPWARDGAEAGLEQRGADDIDEHARAALDAGAGDLGALLHRETPPVGRGLVHEATLAERQMHAEITEDSTTPNLLALEE